MISLMWSQKSMELERWKKGEEFSLPHEEKGPITRAVKSNEMYWKLAAKKATDSSFAKPRLKVSDLFCAAVH